MKRPVPLPCLKFEYELIVEITPTLSFAAGELGELIVDGLFVLDEQGLLFPGVRTPGSAHRLLQVGITPLGYQRRGTAIPIGLAYRRLMRRGRVTKASRDLHDQLCQTAVDLGSSFLEQRSLIAKLMSLSEKCSEAGAVTDADRTVAQTLMAAAKAILDAVGGPVRSAL